MTLWPHSLFHRNLWLIVALIVLGQVGNALLYRQFVMKPRVQLSADATARDLAALDRGLRAMPPAQREAFVRAFNAQAQAQAQVAQARPRPAWAWHPPAHRLLRLEQAFVSRVRERLAPMGAQLRWQRTPGGDLSLSVALHGEGQWLELPGVLPARPYSGAWLLATASAALLALLGAWLIQRRINRPLQQLVHAAQALGRGDQPPPLSETGPTEIATLAHSFNDMVTTLSRNEAERALMLAGLSHDLRTPLAKMRLVSEMLQGQGDPELLASLERSVASLDELLTQFLDYTRLAPGAGWEQEALEDADLNALVREVLALLPPGPGGSDAPETKATDTPNFAPGALPAMRLRPQAMRRLVLNLVMNARRHGRPPVEVATGLAPHGPWLEVRDRGPGVPPEQVAALKAPFARGSASRSGASGAGLGLAIADRVALAHGAQLTLHPREGGGLVARVQW